MHGPIRENLETLLSGNASEAEMAQHLSSCRDCMQELETMRQQADMLRSLRAPEDEEPAPGFYARVLQRVDEQGVSSVWSVFAESSFSKWLVYASLAMALALGTWVVGEERQDGHIGSREPVIAAQGGTNDMPVTGDQAHQRDVVLVNLASYSQGSE